MKQPKKEKTTDRRTKLHTNGRIMYTKLDNELRLAIVVTSSVYIPCKDGNITHKSTEPVSNKEILN